MSEQDEKKGFFDIFSFVYVLFVVGMYAAAFLLWKIGIQKAAALAFVNAPFLYYLSAFVIFTWPLLKVARDKVSLVAYTPRGKKALNWVTGIIAVYGIYTVYLFIKLVEFDL